MPAGHRLGSRLPRLGRRAAPQAGRGGRPHRGAHRHPRAAGHPIDPGSGETMPETELITVTDANFASLVLSAELPFVVDFWAEWCPPCRPMAPVLAELAGEFHGELLIGKLNADENPETTRNYRVMSMPTLLFFTGGTLTGSLVGFRPKSVLRLALANAAQP